MTRRDDALARWREDLGRLARAVVVHLDGHPDGLECSLVEAADAAMGAAVDAIDAGDEKALRDMAGMRSGPQRIRNACHGVFDLLDAYRDQDIETTASELRRALYDIAANAGARPPRRLSYRMANEDDLVVIRKALDEWCAIPRGMTIPKGKGAALHRLVTLYGIAPNGLNSLVQWSKPSKRARR
ncbi:MAG: hypothetical protein JW751_28525 [Polyangiaceae bacterium]|nr:hypothetical protein [Polyangiaceae bacterium]